MPIINAAWDVPMVIVDGTTTPSGDLTVNPRINGVAAGRTTVAGALAGLLPIAGAAAGVTTPGAFLRLYGEPNVLLSGTGLGGTVVGGNLSSGFTPFVAVEGSTTISANLRISEAESSELAMVVDIAPDALGAPGRYITGWLPRLKIDGVEVPVTEWAYTEAPNTAGGDLQVTLARPGDRSLLTVSSQIEFAIGKKIRDGEGIVWDEASMHVFMEGSSVKGYNTSLGWANNSPTDALSVNGSSSIDDKLGVTPATDEIFYDPAKQTLSLDNFEPILDSEGRSYLPTLSPVPGLSLYDVLSRVLVSRCGFTGYQTNIPDFPLSRVDCKMGRGFFDSIKGYFGMFEPVIFEVDDVVWIVDTTTALPAGFPSPRQVGVSEYRTLGLTSAASRLDALLVEYVEQKLAYDYITTRTETKTEESGEFGTENWTSTFTQRLFREYRRFSHPGVVLFDELYHEDRTTTGPGTVGEIASMSENYTYDQLNRLTLRVKTEQGRIPLLNDPETFVMSDLQTETESLSYAPHPFEQRSSYLQRRVISIEGLIAVDSENQQLGTDFEREFSTAYRSGNLVPSMTTRFGAIRTRTETNEPLRDGSVRVTVKETDALSNAVVIETREERVGDISINGISPRRSRMLVFDDENTTRATGRVDSVHFGELPVGIMVPLARRILKARKRKGQTINCDVIGFDPILRRGMVINPRGRLAASLGNFIVLGRQVKGDRTGCEMSLSCKEI